MIELSVQKQHFLNKSPNFLTFLKKLRLSFISCSGKYTQEAWEVLEMCADKKEEVKMPEREISFYLMWDFPCLVKRGTPNHPSIHPAGTFFSKKTASGCGKKADRDFSKLTVIWETRGRRENSPLVFGQKIYTVHFLKILLQTSSTMISKVIVVLSAAAAASAQFQG